MAPPTQTSVMLVSGEYFDYMAPDSSIISLDVLEHGLAAPRFNNQTLRPISIAEHSMRVRRIAADLVRLTDEESEARAKAGFEEVRASENDLLWGQLPDHVQGNWRRRVCDQASVSVEMWALNHDDHEALVPWGDCLSPGKTDEMRAVEAEVDVAVRAALGIALPSESTFSVVKTADAIALYFEALIWQPGAVGWAPILLHQIWCNEQGKVGNSGLTKTSLAERFMPLIAPRPGDDWRAEVEDLLGLQSALA